MKMDEYERGFKDGYKDGLKSKLCEELTPFMRDLMVVISDALKGVPNYVIDHMELKANVDNWISVKDRLPDNVKDVIVCDEFELVYPAYYYTFDECWMYSFTVERCGHRITHWMPLPQKPESDGDAE